MALVRRTLVILMWFSCICINVIADQNSDTTLVYKICNGLTGGYGIIYSQEVNDVLHDLTFNFDSAFNYYTQSTDLDISCYGHSACNGAISTFGCFSCLLWAKGVLTDDCPQNTGAQVQLKDCRMRYENYPFTE